MAKNDDFPDLESHARARDGWADRPKASGRKSAGALDPETSDPQSADSGLSGQIASLAQNVPFVGQLGDFSPTYAFRWLLWLAAVFGSAFGLLAVLAGTIAIILAMGPIASSTNSVLGAAGSGVYELAGSLDGTSLMVGNVSNVSTTIADSLANMSTGLGKTADSIESLKNIPGQQNGQADWSGAANSLRSSYVGLQTAAGQARDAGNGSVQAAAGISEAANSMRAMSSGLITAQGSVSTVVMYAQIGAACMGLAVALLLGGVFALALAYGPPKKN